jgi:Ca2+-binding EF-hand superfamily protein
MKSERGRIALFFLSTVAVASFLLGQTKKAADQTSASVPREHAAWTGFSGSNLLNQIDEDRDGVSTRDEWERYFRDTDANKDDRLTPDEILAGAKAKGSEPEGPDAARDAAFHRLDVNRDDLIERAEWPGNDRSFNLMDANRDNALSLEEFLSRNGRYWNELFEDLDFDGNGIITRKEWLDSETAFQRLDHDRNGIIDRFEFYTPK